jgi:hypothetical protein
VGTCTSISSSSDTAGTLVVTADASCTPTFMTPLPTGTDVVDAGTATTVCCL